VFLKNLTKNTIIATDLKECVSFKDRNLGLLDQQNPRSLLFKTRFGIHTFGLSEPIDVLVLSHVELLGAKHLVSRFFASVTALRMTGMGIRHPELSVRVKDLKAEVVKANLKPNRFFFWNPIFDTVIELPNGAILDSKTQSCDLLSIIP